MGKKPHKKPRKLKGQTIGECLKILDAGHEWDQKPPSAYGKPSGCTRFKLKDNETDFKVIR